MKHSILIVDDEPDFLHVLKSYFSYGDFEAQTASSGQKALKCLEQSCFDVVVTDMAMPGMTGIELLKAIRKTDRHTPVIIMTGVGTIESAVEATKLGAFHYITKPFNPQDLENLVIRASEHGRMNRQLSKQENVCREEKDFVMGTTKGVRDVIAMIDRIAASDAPVLIMGETGTGKSLFARRTHLASSRRNKSFLTIDCAALAETLLESELFGHVKGAFTGAVSAKRGLLEEAEGGTIFLDEIGELSPSTQVKLLRAIQEHEIKPVGGNKSIHVDVRFISATSRDLNEEIRAGRFREDLYFRLAVIPLYLPPLRERLEDLPLFVDHFIKRFNTRYKKQVSRVDQGFMNMLRTSAWKGNIRELENTIERAVLLCEKDTVTVDSLLFGTPAAPGTGDQESPPLLKEIIENAERQAIIRALAAAEGNRTAAAKNLGIARRTLYDKMELYHLE
jgi:DNA-binding NtrC family response regulator